MNDIIFDYYRGVEAEQYSFYRIPKMLFYRYYSFKICHVKRGNFYGLMLDRMSSKPKKSLDG